MGLDAQQTSPADFMRRLLGAQPHACRVDNLHAPQRLPALYGHWVKRGTRETFLSVAIISEQPLNRGHKVGEHKTQ